MINVLDVVLMTHRPALVELGDDNEDGKDNYFREAAL